ncbi:MAG: T9SS type A sorting domain-containing protein [Vicingaceae bacterium]
MKKLILYLSIITFTSSGFAAIDTVTNFGNTFTPASITIAVGDTVFWDISLSHNVVEVDSATYASNGTTSNGGYTLPFGGGSQEFNTEGTYYYVCTPHASIGMKGIIRVVPNSTSISEEKLASQFSFYPNPAKEQLTIEIPLNKDFELLEITNELGQVVYSNQITSKKVTVDLSQFSQGIYLVNLRSGDAILTRKLIVE